MGDDKRLRLSRAASEAWWEYYRLHPLGEPIEPGEPLPFENADWLAIDAAWDRYQAAEKALRELPS